MLNVPAEIQAVIKNDATLKNFRVHFPNGERVDITNENIVFESVSFTESVCSSDVFRFGLAEASVIEFETMGVENIAGKTIECSMEFAVPASLQETYGDWYSIPYGTFIVDKCPRNHQNITHRKVTGYSALKEDLGALDFFQKLTLPVPKINLPLNSLLAYYTNDVSMFNERGPATKVNGWLLQDNRFHLYTAGGTTIAFGLVTESSFKKASVTISGQTYIPDLGFKFVENETGTMTNEEFGMEFVRQFNEKFDMDVRYDQSGKQIFETNEEAIRYAYPELFQPWFHESIMPDGSNFQYRYRGRAVEKDRFNPVFFDNNLNSKEYYGGYVVWLNGVSDAGEVEFRVYQNDASIVYPSAGQIKISGYSSDRNVYYYRASSSSPNIGRISIKNTLSAKNVLMSQGKPSSKYKNYYGTMYNYSNAFSAKDILNGIAELKGKLIKQNRDGSTGTTVLDNSSPYEILLSDVEGNTWWDEYDVSQIGTVKYTFTNPATGQIESGSYTFDSSAKSVYDLSGNKAFESLNFNIYKANSEAKMTDTSVFYLYTGTTDDYYTKDHFYFNTGSAGSIWTDGGLYKDVTSLIEFALDNYFVPYINGVNFTPVEMDIRGLPFLEAGDAFTLTAEDGTVLNSYVLNHTISGIQHLTESIDSVSGEVIK